jgi:hypothetical protein
MTFHLKLSRLLLALACVCQIVAVSPSALSQTTSAVQQEQNDQPEQQLVVTNRIPPTEAQLPPAVQRSIYNDLISDLGWEEIRRQQAAKEDKQPEPPEITASSRVSRRMRSRSCELYSSMLGGGPARCISSTLNSMTKSSQL